MKGTTEPIYTKAVSNKKRALEAHISTLLLVSFHPSHKIIFLRICNSEKSELDSSKNSKNLEEADLYLQNMKKQHTIPYGNTVDQIIPLKDIIESQP